MSLSSGVRNVLWPLRSFVNSKPQTEHLYSLKWPVTFLVMIILCPNNEHKIFIDKILFFIVLVFTFSHLDLG